MGKKAKLTFWGSLACAVVGAVAVAFPPFAPFAPALMLVIGGLTGVTIVGHTYTDTHLSRPNEKKSEQ